MIENQIESIPLISKTKEELNAIDLKIKLKMIPKRINNLIYFKHYVFPLVKIYLFLDVPTIYDLQKLNLSKNQIADYINHKNYKQNKVLGRCKYYKEIKSIIICVKDFNVNDYRKISTLSHELIHCSHRLFESKNINFTEEGLCHLHSDLLEIALYEFSDKIESEFLDDYDLLWNSIIITSTKD